MILTRLDLMTILMKSFYCRDVLCWIRLGYSSPGNLIRPKSALWRLMIDFLSTLLLLQDGFQIGQLAVHSPKSKLTPLAVANYGTILGFLSRPSTPWRKKTPCDLGSYLAPPYSDRVNDGYYSSASAYLHRRMNLEPWRWRWRRNLLLIPRLITLGVGDPIEETTHLTTVTYVKLALSSSFKNWPNAAFHNKTAKRMVNTDRCM